MLSCTLVVVADGSYSPLPRRIPEGAWIVIDGEAGTVEIETEAEAN
jgi:hypothetical protein